MLLTGLYFGMINLTGIANFKNIKQWDYIFYYRILDGTGLNTKIIKEFKKYGTL